jgi:N-hydroxyarylamine O-acetyltransferase
MLRRGPDGEESWKPQYRFTLASRRLPQFHDMCVHQQTSPKSHFTQQRICSLATQTGRITLSDLKLITTSHGVREERMLSGEDEFNSILATSFGIVP